MKAEIESPSQTRPTEAIIKRICKAEPALCEYGLDPVYAQKHGRHIDPEHFELCVKWLELCQVRKTINPNIGSYGLKHRVERYFGRYVTNGAFIAAVIYLRIPYKRNEIGPNIRVALSSRHLPNM